MTSPIEAIETLKTFLEKELITSDEYDSRRAQVLDGLAPAPATAQFTLRGISGSGLSLRTEPPGAVDPVEPRRASRIPFEDRTEPPEPKDASEG